MSSIKYRPEIDGLRSLAIIPVVLFHMGFEGIEGGFIGVDVFFVISGYLITLIILKDYDKGEFTFSRFWFRRIRRIFPALIVMVIATSVIGYNILFGSEINDLGIHGLSAVLSFANISMWQLAGNYWGAKAENSLFLHAWSLSVEEQFYLFFPVIIFLLLKFGKKWIFKTLLILAISSFLLYLYASKHYPYASFYLLPTRAWELASGCLLAISTWRYDFKVSESTSLLLSFIGFIAILFSYLFISGEDPFPGQLLIPIIGSTLIIAFSKSETSLINKLLSFSPLVYIGKISYSLYLWHWPVLVLAKKLQLKGYTGISSLTLISIILLCSITSYHLIENNTRERKKILPLIFFAFIVSLSISFFLYTKKSPYNTDSYNKVVWNGALYNVSPGNFWHKEIKNMVQMGIIAPLNESQKDTYSTGGIIKYYGKNTPNIVVLGDSQALMWSGVIDEICKELNITVSFYSATGVSPFIKLPLKIEESAFFFTAEEKYLFDKKKLDFIKQWKPQIVIIATRWSNVQSADVTKDLMQFLEEVDTKTILIESIPELFFGDQLALTYLTHKGIKPKENQNFYIQTSNAQKFILRKKFAQELSRQYKQCDYIDAEDIFYSNTSNAALVLEGFNILYMDEDHLSQYGALKAKSRIKEKIIDTLNLP